MKNPRLAGRYAKSLLEIAMEQNQLDAVYADMKMLHGLAKTNPDLTAMLRSPIIARDKKDKILEAVLGNKVSVLTMKFTKLLTAKTRESNLPEIAVSFISKYNELKNIRTVKLTTAAPVSDEVKNNIISKIQGGSNGSIELQTAVNEDLIGGFKLETGDILVDATILRELNDVRRRFLRNDYLSSLR